MFLQKAMFASIFAAALITVAGVTSGDRSGAYAQGPSPTSAPTPPPPPSPSPTMSPQTTALTCPPSHPNFVFDGKALRDGTGTAETDIAACTLAMGDASTLLAIETSRQRDEECLDFRGDWFDVGNPIVAPCDCEDAPNNNRTCIAKGSQSYICCISNE